VSAHQGSDFEDRRFPVTVGSSINVGPLTAAAQRNEVIGFTAGRAPAITLMAPWTGGPNTVPLQFPDEIQIAITVFVIDPPFSQQAIADHCTTAVAMWLAERMGVSFGSTGCDDIRDETNAPSLSQYRGRGTGFSCDGQENLQRLLPPVAGRINVYIVNKIIPGGPGWGETCAPDFIALGSEAIDGTFVHELGHAFSLVHTDGMANFDSDNVMMSDSGTRMYFTEGQSFRAHFTPRVPPNQGGSALNVVYAARPNLPVRDCDVRKEPCPALERRIWADGALGPN
jgi:ribosomal protein S18 acetylase RimI-like enzyme